MNLAPLALGFALGVIASGLVVVPLAITGLAVAWRWAKAVEKAGFAITLRQERP